MERFEASMCQGSYRLLFAASGIAGAISALVYVIFT